MESNQIDEAKLFVSQDVLRRVWIDRFDRDIQIIAQERRVIVLFLFAMDE